MKLRSIKKDLFFVPVFKGNQDLPKGEQVRVVYKDRPPASRVRVLVSRINNGTAVEDEHEFVSEFVETIENFEIDGEAVDTFEKLIGCKTYGVVPLMAEIGSDLIKIDGFEEGEE